MVLPVCLYHLQHMYAVLIDVTDKLALNIDFR